MRMGAPKDMEAARQARRSINVVRKKLLNPTPEILDSCAPHLRVAIDSLALLEDLLLRPRAEAGPSIDLAVARRGLEAEVAGFRQELGQVHALLRGASSFYGGLARLLAPAEIETVDYTRGGAIAARPGPLLQMEG